MPLSFDLICALAFQESGELWSKLRLRLPLGEDVLRLSVGDTLDEPNHSAFPKNRDALNAAPRGEQMFDLAHQLLIEMGDAAEIEVYQHLGRRSEKFCTANAAAIFAHRGSLFALITSPWRRSFENGKRIVTLALAICRPLLNPRLCATQSSCRLKICFY
jgi:hypothetical protein